MHRYLEPTRPSRHRTFRRCGNCRYPVKHVPRIHTLLCILTDRIRRRAL